ncbi:MAG: T9SS type A sorting domain-containing protein [Bacteroidota bacterium]
MITKKYFLIFILFITPLLFFGQGIIIQPGAFVTVQNSAYVKTTGTAGLRIKSTSSGTGSLIDFGSGISVSGSSTATVERYIVKDFKWHFLSSPVSAQPLWPEFAPTPSGSTYLDYTWGSGPAWGWDFYYWNPNSSTTTQLYWVNPRNSNGTYNYGDLDLTGNGAGYGTSTPPIMAVGRGYLVAYDAIWNSATGSPTTHSFTGTLNSGNKSRTITLGVNHFNLVGNPYPSSIDWKGSGWTRANLATSGSGYDYWIFNDTDGNYGVYNSASVSDAGTHSTTRYIAPMQGFFVEAASDGSLGMTSAVQTHSTQTWLKESAEENNILRLKLTTDANTYNDEMIIAVDPAFDNGGSHKFWSMYEEAPEIYSVKNGTNFSIDRMPAVGEGTVINVGIKAGVVSNYTLTVTGVSGFSKAKSVILEDLKTGTTRNLNENNVYSFNGGPGDASARFHLHFGGPYATTEPGKTGPVSFYAFENAIYIRSNTASELKGEVLIYNMLGQLVKNEKVSGEQCRIKMNSPTGYYIVSLVIESRVYRIKILIQ